MESFGESRKPARSGMSSGHNNCTQATPVCALRNFLAQVPGAPGAGR